LTSTIGSKGGAIESNKPAGQAVNAAGASKLIMKACQDATNSTSAPGQ